MCEILLSVRPEYSKMIFSGLKTVELRKKIGVKFDVGKKIYIYTTSPIKEISGEAVISGIKKGPPADIKKAVLKQAGISSHSYDDYFAGSEFAYAIFLGRVLEYKKKVLLSELRFFNVVPPQSFCYVSNLELINKLSTGV